MSNIIFNTELIKGAKGDTGDTGLSYEVPTGAVIAYDGTGVPEGYIETTEPLPPTPSAFDLDITTVTAGEVSNLNTTYNITEGGLYVVLFSTATNTGGDNGYISYSGTADTDYILKHSYRASNASPAATYPTIAVDLIEVINPVTVTMFSYGQGYGGVSYAILKLDNVSDFGNVASETYYRGYQQLDTVNLSNLTITTPNVFILAFGTAKYDNRTYSNIDFTEGILNYGYAPFKSQIGAQGYSDGFALLIPSAQISAVNTYSSDDCTKCILIAEVIDA